MEQEDARGRGRYPILRMRSLTLERLFGYRSLRHPPTPKTVAGHVPIGKDEGRRVPSMKGLIAGAVLLLVAVVVLQSLPDFQRYQQLRDM